MEKGILRVSKKLGGNIDKKYTVPKIYNLAPREKYHLKEVEFELDKNRNVIKVLFYGQELPKNEDEIEKRKGKEDRIRKREEQKQKEEIERKENQQLIEFYKNDFVKAEKAFLPSDSLNVLSENEWKVDNFSLRLNKLARFEEDERNFSKSKFQFFKTDRGRVIFEPKNKFSEELISEIHNKNLKSAKKIIGKDENLFTQTLNLNWRMAVGLGHESVYETSITLHHIYGIPYIPASSIKGVVRSWIITEVFGQDNLEKAEEKALENKDFVKIFGKQESQGEIIFFDAFPIEEPTIEPDIMNVHYPDYYDDKKGIVAPTDYQSPRPIIFLTVKNTPFQFVIGSKKEQLDKYKISGQTIDWWLKEALENHGIGAKTAVGYGRMK